MKHIRFCLFTIVVLLGNFTATGQIEEPIDLAANADQMLYTNAKCTNETYGDQFTSWDVLFDGNANTFFHSEYSNVDSEDGQDHYLRVDMGKSAKEFSFTYTVRGTIPNNGNYSPKTMVVEGSNIADGEYTEIATLTNLPSSAAAVYKSGILGNGNAYRYIRFRVTETFTNSKAQGHPYFFIAEFGVMKVRIGGTCGDNLSWKLTDENELIIEGTGRMYEYAYYDEKPWYEYRGSIQTITIGDKVTSIGSNAFSGCSITSITIPESVTSIGNDAFYGCSSLESITIPEGVTSIGNCAFSYCSSLTAITIPEGVTSIENEAFNGCTALKKVIIEDGSTTLSLGYNYYESNGTGEGLFYDCPLEEVYLGRDLSYDSHFSYGYSPFYNKTKLTALTIGDKVTSIGNSAFENCNSLTAIKIPESVTSIGESAFYECSSLTAITIPEGVTSIGDGAFYDCSSLKKVIIEDGSTTLSLGYNYSGYVGRGIGLFYDCPLEEVYLGRDLSYSSSSSYGYSPFYNQTQLTALTIGDKVTSIRENAFKECNNLTAITIPASVTLIGESAFSTPDRVIWLANTPPTGYTYVKGRINYAPNDKYSTLSNVKIYPYLGSMFEVGGLKYVPVNPTERTCDAIDCAYNNAAEAIMIGEVVSFKGTAMTVKAVMPFTFSGNKYIKEVHISHKGNIGDYAFYNCDSIQSVVLTNEGNVGKYVFGYCESLNTITLGEKITSLGDYVFAGCSSLTDVIIEDRTSALALGSNGSSSLFVDCPLDSVYIGGTITYNATSDKGYSPFNTNKTLRAVVISDHAEQIYDYAFYDCANLQSIIIGDGVKRIGNYAFSKCSSLDSVTLSKNIKALGIEAFAGCSDLKEITCYACVPPTCGEQALNGIDILGCQLKVPTGCMDAYKAADQWKDFFFIEDVLEVAKYTITYMVDNEVYKSVDYTYDESIIAEDNPIKEGYTFGGWSWMKKEEEASPINLASNADAMLYTNAKCTNETYGDQFKSWDVLFDGNANTFFHSEYSNVDSEDGQDHYLRVDMGKSAKEFSFTYTVRGTIPNNGNYSPKTMVVEGSNKADGEYAKIATLTNLPSSAAAVYESGILGNGNAYRYIRFRVTETFANSKVQGHPYFFIAEFGIAECIEKQVETSGVPTTMPAEDIVIHGSFVEKTNQTILDTTPVYAVAMSFPCPAITYTRNFADTKWQPLYVPFEIAYENICNDFEVAYIYNTRQYDHDEDGVKDETIIEAFKMKEGMLEANYPYLIRAKEAGEKSIEVTNATLYATEENTIDCASVFDTYTFKGTYSQLSSTTLTPGKGYYTLVGDEWQPATEATSLGAFRFYLKVDSRHGAPAAEARSIRMRFVGENNNDDDVTEIENAESREEKAALIYDLQGRRVEKMTRGVYILNGKKVVIK